MTKVAVETLTRNRPDLNSAMGDLREFISTLR